MGSNCCKGDSARPVRSSSSIYSRSRAGGALDDRFTTSEDAGGVRLTVSAARAGDTGVYTLQASNAAGSDTSRVRLEVFDDAASGEDPPTFLRRLQDLTVKVGTRTRFLVEIISSTECKVTWYRNERRLMEAERVALARDGNFWCADLAAVSVDDAGRWTCTAENAGGRASCSAHLNVLVPKAYKRPEFVEELRALLTEQGTVSLECKVIGVPTPVLRWFKDSREIKAGDVFALTANAEDPTSLGTYTCEAVNCMGRAYSSSKVHVVGRASREGSAKPSTSALSSEPPPIFTKELEDHQVKICEPFSLNCQLVVPPWPRSVVWYNKDGKVEPGERYHVLEDGAGGYLLEISPAEWADEGEWKVVANSAGGRVGISSCYVAMDVPKNYRKPRFMENLQAVLTEEGLVSFECKVVGFPTPVLSWFKDGQELKPGDVYQLTGTNSLGSYCCIAKNCMGQASSSAELTVEDIQNQLNEEEKLQLFPKNQAPKFVLGLKSVEAKIDEPFRFTVKVAIPPEPSVLWYRDDQPVDESSRCHLSKEDRGGFSLDIQSLEFLDQAEWKCVAMNDFGHSVTSCFLKLIIPRHYKKPRFLENLQAILSEEGAVNLECKVIGVPQPVLKWYKDGEELKPGDIHRIISGQDGTCCLGTYTCEAQNCMGVAASSASLLGFDDSMKAKAKKTEEQALQRNLSLSTIHEERTSQMYDTPIGDITLDDKGEISFSFDGKEVSVSLYETPDLTEEEALQVVEMYADQLSENVTEHNVVELPPLRFVKETSTSGNLLMEAIIIDVSPEYFTSPEEDLRTEADIEDISIADENGPPQLSLDQDIDIGGEDYLEKTMALLSDDRSDIPMLGRKKSDSQRSGDDFFSLSLDQSEGKRDDDTHVSGSEPQSFASARSSGKAKSKSSKPSAEEGQESTEPTKTIVFKEDVEKKQEVKKQVSIEEEEIKSEKMQASPAVRPKRERRVSRGSRRSSSGSEKSLSKSKEELLRIKADIEQPRKPSISNEDFNDKMANISTSLTKVINDVQLIERDIILKSELMSSVATASRSLEIISSLITPLSEINSIADAAKESVTESREVTSTIFNSLPQSLKKLQQSLTIVEKCIDMESDNKTLVKKTCVSFIETCGTEVQNIISDILFVTTKDYLLSEQKVLNEIESVAAETNAVIKFSSDTIKSRNLLSEATDIKPDEPTIESKHLKDTQKAIFELKTPLNSLLRIVKNAETGKVMDLSTITNSEVLLNDMSASIQDLQTALEHIEYLSVTESDSVLNKYNTEIIESVMEPVVNLRGSFEKLSTETRIEDKSILKEALTSIKQNLSEISSHINTIETKVGQYDVIQNDNKLDVLQKMAQILITLENSLNRLETLPQVKSHMEALHKNLTTVLERVIDSNDAGKYFTLMEICDAVNRINTSIKDVDLENVLPLASISNTLHIIHEYFKNDIFDSELNCSITTNIADVLVSIQEAVNKAEEASLIIDSEHAQSISTATGNAVNVNIIMEHINQTIAAIDTVKSLETTQEIKLDISPVLENICPVLEELKRSIAYARREIEQDEQIVDLSETSFIQTMATPLCVLNQNVVVLNHLIMDNIDSIKEQSEMIAAIAEPLHELHSTLEVLQQNVISQYGEDVTPYDVSVNMASVVQNLQSCILMIQEQAGVEGVDEMSTLEDISGIKTSADTLPSDRLVLPTAEETAIEESYRPLEAQLALTSTAQTLQSLNEHLTVLHTPEVIDALDTLSEVSDYSSLKSVAVGLGELHNGIESILHPILMEGSTELFNQINVSKLVTVAEPMQELQQSLSVLDLKNIPLYESILDLPTEKVHSVFQTLSEFKNDLDKCVNTVLPALDVANSTIEISTKVSNLRGICEHLKDVIETTKNTSENVIPSEMAQQIEVTVDNLLEATDVTTGIKVDEIKCITEELYSKLVEVQDDIIQFTSQTPEKSAQEAKIIQVIGEVETNIAVLEQYDFLDLSQVSDITSCVSPQMGHEAESDSLLQIDDIVENAVNIVQDSLEETPVADLMIVEDFFRICKNEFTILRCLITKATSHKKLIRLIQEFTSLRTIITDFKVNRKELKLSNEIESCLDTFFASADESLKNVQTSLVNIIHSHSDILIKTPETKLESLDTLISVSQTKSPVSEVIRSFVKVAETARPIVENLQTKIIDNLTQEPEVKYTADETKLIEEMESFTFVLENQMSSEETDNRKIRALKELSTIVSKHQDYKDATGAGKTLIIIKCLSECMDVLEENILEKKKIRFVETSKEKENSLKQVLTEMLQPLQALQAKLSDIREHVSTGVDESISIDLISTESLVQAMSELHKDAVEQVEQENATVDSADLSLLIKVDKEIHSIQDSIKAIENIPEVQTIKEITKPMEAIEKSLHELITSQTSTESKLTLNKEQAAVLLPQIEQYIELIEIVEEISAVIKLENAQESFEIARELKESILATENIIEDDKSKEKIESIRETQVVLAQQLQRAISALQVQVLDSAHELAPELSSNVLQKIAQVTAQLQANLIAVTGVQIAIQAPLPVSETTKALDKNIEELSTTTEPEKTIFVAEKLIPGVVEQVEVDSSVQAIVESAATTSVEEVQVLETVEDKTAAVVISNEQETVTQSIGATTVESVVVDEAKQDVPEIKPEGVISVEAVDVQQSLTETPSVSTQSAQVQSVEDSKTILTEAEEKSIEAENKEKLTKVEEKSVDVEVTLVTDKLSQHIKEYVAEDITEVVDQLCTIFDTEDLKQSVNIARELQVKIASIDETNEISSELKDQIYEDEVKLTQHLQTALNVLHQQGLEHLQEIVPSLNVEVLEKVTKVGESLQAELETVVSSQQEIKQQIDRELTATVGEESEVISGTEVVTTEQTVEVGGQATLNKEAPVQITPETSQVVVAESTDLIPEEEKPQTEVPQSSIEVESLLENIPSQSTSTVSVEELKELRLAQEEKDVKAVETVEHEKVTISKEDIAPEVMESVSETTDNIVKETEQVLGTTETSDLVTAVTQETVASEETQPIENTDIASKSAAPLEETPTTGTAADVSVSVKDSEIPSTSIVEDKDTGLPVEDSKLPAKEAEIPIDIVEQVAAEQVTESQKEVESVDAGIVYPELEQAVEKLDEPLQIASKKHENLIQHINEFITEEVSELVGELSALTNVEALKETVNVAKELRESIVAVSSSSTAEESTPFEVNVQEKQSQLVQKLQDALTTLQIEAFDSLTELPSVVTADSVQKVADLVLHLQDDLAVVSEESALVKTDDTAEAFEPNSIKQLESLLQDVNEKITITATGQDTEETEVLKNALDEVQTVIIKLKHDYDGTTNDTLNETLEDLECSVRSVQLQINEVSPPELLQEACATLKLLVDNINTTQEIQSTETTIKLPSPEVILENCSKETEETVKLLEMASKVEIKSDGNMVNIIESLKTLTNNLKLLRENFLSDSNTLIENGIDLIQCLDKIEEQIFTLEKDIESESNIKASNKEIILTAVHSVFSSLSNMRSTIASIQKQYMLDNYGKPSEHILVTIKNVSFIATLASESEKPEWKSLSTSLRNMLNHFEDIKFYINLDKTARLPSDAAFTKIILDELRTNIQAILIPQANKLGPKSRQKVDSVVRSIKKHLKEIESQNTLEVKKKLIMFKEISKDIYNATNLIKSLLQETDSTEKTIDDITDKKDKEEVICEESVELIDQIEKESLESKVAQSEETCQVLEELEKDVKTTSKEEQPSTSKQADLEQLTFKVEEEVTQTDSLAAIQQTEEVQTGVGISSKQAKVDEFIEEEKRMEEIENEKLQKEKDAAEKSKKDREQSESQELEDANLRQETEQAVTEKEEGTGRMQKEKEEAQALITKEKEESERLAKEEQVRLEKEKEVEQARIAKENEDTERIQKEKEESEILQREKEEQAHITKQKEDSKELEEQEQARVTKEKEESDRVKKEKEESEILQKDKEDQTRIAKEREEQARIAKEKEGYERLEKEKEGQTKDKDDSEKVQKEKEEQDQITKENEESEILQKENEEEQSRLTTTTTLEKEEQARIAKEKEESETLQKEREEAERMEKEKEAEKEKLGQEAADKKKKKEEKAKAKKEKEEAERIKKEKEEQAQIAQEKEKQDRISKEKEESERLQRETEEAERIKKEKEEQAQIAQEKENQDRISKEKEESERLQRETEEAERIQKEDDDGEGIQKEKADSDRTQKEKDASEKEQQEQEAADKKKKKEGKAKAKKEKEEAESIQKEKEETDHIQKEKEESERIQNEQEEARRSQKEKDEAERIQRERESAELKQKEEEQARIAEKEKEEAEGKQKEKDEADRLQKETEAAELKMKQEELARITEKEKLEQEAAEKKKKKDEKAKTKKQKEESDRIQKEKEEAERMQKEKEETERNQKEKDEAERILKEKKEAERIQNEKEEADRLQNEKEEAQRLQKEKEEAERLQKEKQEAERLQKVKQEAERLQKEKEEDQRLQKEKEQAERLQKEKQEAERQQKEKQEAERLQEEKEEAERLQKQMEEAERLQKEKEEADRLQKEKEEALRLQKEKEEAERLQKEKQEAERLQKEKQEAERLQKEKEEAERLQKEKEEAERIQKEKEEADRIQKEKEEAQRLQKEKQEAERLQKEKDEAELIEKEEQARLAEKEAADKKKKKEEKAKAKKEKEETERIKKEKEEAERMQKEKEEAERLQKEKEEAQRLQKEKQEAERLQKEKEEAELIEKEEQARLAEKEAADKKKKKEENAKAKKEKEEAERIKKEKEEAERMQKEKEEAERLQKEKEEAERIQKEKEEADRIQKEKDEAERLQKEKEEAERLQKEKEEAERLQKEKEEAERLQQEKEEAERVQKEKEEAKQVQKEKEEAEHLQREKEETELKQKEAENATVAEKENLEQEAADKKKKKEEKAKAKKEKDEAERIQKEKGEAERIQKEKEEYERIQKEKDEAQRIQKENEAADKEKLEQEAAEKKKKKEEKAKAKKEKEEAERIQKEKAETDRIQKEKAETERIQKEKEESDRIQKDKEEADRIQKEKEETVRKQQEDQARIAKEKEEQDRVSRENEEAEAKKKKAEKLKAKKEKEQADLKQKQEEAENLKKDKEEADKIQKQKEEQARHAQEKEEAEKLQKEAAGKKTEEEAAEKKKKEEIARTEQEKGEVDKVLKDQADQKQIEEEHARATKDKEESKKLKKDKEESESKKIKRGSLEKKKDKEGKATKEKQDVKIKEEETRASKTLQDTIESSETKERKRDIVDISTEESEKYRKTYSQIKSADESQSISIKRENGHITHDKDSTSHDKNYIKEYQYEPTSTSYKHEPKEKPTFVNHNHKDYTMEFARPPGYRERSFDVDRSSDYKSLQDLGKNATIYKAQTLVLDSQLRSSLAPPSPDLNRRSDSSDTRRAESRLRSKALSETRSIISEKRSASSRDAKRKPVFSTYLTDRTAVEGSRVKLTCSALSSTDPTITWYRNGVLLDKKLKYRTKFVDGLITLEVLNAVPSDSAEYSCTVENENGSVSTSATLKVYPSFEASPIPPTFTRSIRDTYHLAENELVLECRIRGQPLPTITWLKNDKPVVGNERYQAYYLADGVCRLAIEHPTPEDSGKYTCKAENSVWSDQISHVVNFTGKESRLSPNLTTVERSKFTRQAFESRRPHFTNVLTDYKVAKGGTIGLQVEIRGAPTRVEWLREGHSVTEHYRNAFTFVEQGLYTLALSDVTEKESGLYTCRAWSTHGNVDMNAAITVVPPTDLDGKPAVIVGRPAKDLLISVGEDVNISFRVQGEPKPKVIFMKGIRDITTNQRVCKMTSDDYVKFTLKRSVVSDAGTYCILARNAYGCDRAFVTVEVRQRASSDNLISDWTYPIDESTMTPAERKYKSVPDRIPGEPSVVDGGNNWVSLVWPKPDPGEAAPVLAYRVEVWQLGKEGGARWLELGITPLNSFDAFNLKQGEEYHFRVTPRNRYGWGESVQTTSPIGVGLAGDRPEFVDILPGQFKILTGETANLNCSVKGKPAPEVVWMKNGHEIEDGDSRIKTSFNGFDCCLTIKDINIEDEARYSCEASNVHGRASTYARLAVVTDRLVWEADAKLKRERSSDVDGEYPPQFTMRLRDRRVQATYPVRLTCQVVGCPPPAVTWYKDGEEVDADSRHCKSQDEHFHTLEIAPTTLEDGGVYEALARNSCGAVSCRCSLVVDKGIRAYVAPEFCCGLEPLYRLCDGEELRISAVVEAYPSVGVTWYRDGVRLRPSRRTIMTLDRDGQIELALAAVMSRDAGVYTCTASNEVGRASTSGKVEVVGGGDSVRTIPPVVLSPDVPYSKEPMFIRKPRSSEAREGDTVIIQCEVVGDPKPDVYWLRDFLKPDYYRDATHFRRVGDGPEYRFEIPHAKLDYTGAYSVVARNVHGETKAIISLQILAKDPGDEAHNVRYGEVEVIPRFERQLTDLLSYDGDAVEFECRISGHPDPNVRWFHYHDLIRDCSDFETTLEEGTARLKIRQVTAEDEGTYTCEAANCLGKASTSACLVVYPPGEPNTLSQRLRRPPALFSAASTPRSTPRTTPARSVSRTPGPDPRRLCSPQRQMAPTFYTYPFNKVAEEGDNITLQCAVKGLPSPWATWDKDGVIISPSSRITIKEKDEILRILEIEQVTTDDVGVYRITVENEFGRAEASARLEVITHRGKFYSGMRAFSPSPRKSYSYRSRRTPSPAPRQD